VINDNIHAAKIKIRCTNYVNNILLIN